MTITITIKKISKNLRFIIICAFVLLSGCREEDPIIDEDIVQLPPQTVTTITGFYLLNEGNMNMNKASLDFFDYATGVYRRNIFGQTNPDAVLGLGDMGNALGIYGSKLYAVINGSNKVEVMDVRTTKRLKVIDIREPRFITFANGKAYVSAYDGSLQTGVNLPNGFVFEIDTTTLAITRMVMVGRQPEELAVVGNKLYVANSGFRDALDPRSDYSYETIVSVIDLNTFEKIGEIDVAINLQRLRADAYGNLWVSSLGDFFDIPSRLFVICTQIDEVINTFDIACSNLTIVGDMAYIIGSEFNLTTLEQTINYSMINVKTQTLLEGSFLPQSVIDAIDSPHGIAVDPVSRKIYITDARDYVSPGRLFCVDKYGNFVFEVITGDIPSHIAFVK